MPKEIQKSRSGWEEFARVAMATTSLSLIGGGIASAQTVTEPPAVFPGAFPGLLLPVGTTTVIGNIIGAADTGSEQWFEFQGLQPGGTFSLFGSVTGIETGTHLLVYNSSNMRIGGSHTIGEEGGETATGPIPSDGELIIETLQSPSSGTTRTYEIDLTAPLAPASAPTSVPASSPLSLSVLGLGLALTGGLAWRSKRGAES